MIGEGVLRGMGITFRTMLETYPWGRGLLRLLHIPSTNGLITIQYPEQRQVQHERFRYFPFLVHDGDAENPRCVACKICEKECPPQCIYIEGDKDAQGRPLKRPKVFDIDISVCMSCNICVEVCPFEAIKMDNRFEYAGYERFLQLRATKEDLLKPNAYFQAIKPVESAEVDARLAAKATKTAAKPA
ncbi:MAG: 4Fe-4S dicluster domain-containing protein [Candidatus Omnitrophica bacterium]|nr:4Fe-4S dicluster domain-containing protein [Candidatus Omnitrophota bacterium]